MARKRTLHLSALNITLHPHSPDRYIDLLKEARRQEVITRYRGERRAMIGYVAPRDRDDPTSGIDGDLFTFVSLDPDTDWLNLRTGKEAQKGDMQEVSLPSHLKPELRRYHFAFFPRQHRLFFESRTDKGQTLSPGSAQKIFDSLLNSEALVKDFGPADIVVEPTHEALDAILSMHRLDSLTIHINRPNPDDAGNKTEHKVLERLKRQNARAQTEQLQAIKGESIQPDEESQALARVAASNGYVKGHGRDEQGKVDTESTKDHPLVEPISYDPDVEATTAALWREAGRLLKSIMSRK